MGARIASKSLIVVLHSSGEIHQSLQPFKRLHLALNYVRDAKQYGILGV